MRRPQGAKVLAGLVFVVVLGLGTLLPGTAAAETHCGQVRSLGVELIVSKVSCRQATRIVAAYQQSGFTRGAPKKVPGFLGWKCSNGDRLGVCTKGRLTPGAPTIDFSFLEQPGQARPVPEGGHLDGPIRRHEERPRTGGRPDLLLGEPRRSREPSR
jgi:hypothetical protein